LPQPGTDYQSLPNAVIDLLPAPTAQDGKNTAGPSQHRRNTLPLNTEVTLLPTPTVMDMGANYTPEEWEAWKQQQKANHQNGNGHGPSLYQEAISLLPTPRATDGTDAPANLTPSVAAILDGSMGRTPRLSEMAMDWPSSNDAVSLLPTPRAQDEYERRNHKTMIRIRDEGGDMTLPTWAKVIAPSLGESTSPLSDDGNGSSTDSHQPQLF